MSFCTPGWSTACTAPTLCWPSTLRSRRGKRPGLSQNRKLQVGWKMSLFYRLFCRAGKSKKKTKASAKKPKLRPYLAEIASYQVLHYIASSSNMLYSRWPGSCPYVCWLLQDAGWTEIWGKDCWTKSSVWQWTSAIRAQVWNFMLNLFFDIATILTQIWSLCCASYPTPHALQPIQGKLTNGSKSKI